MSGMPYPSTVAVTVDGRTYRGCGGDPEVLLMGKEWVVEDVNREGIIDRSRLTLNFSADKRIFGHAGCNTYSGRYTLTGEGLTVASPTTTLKACAESLMDQEDRFLKTLARVRRFEITRSGALALHSDDGQSITARR
jgi:heat shock protein HslJ